MILALFACAQNPGFGTPGKEETGDSTPWVTTTPTDTADTDGDLDDDGFTPEEGDCDDTDVHVSPAREEDDGDGIDNDCDGRIDEQFAGVTIAHLDAAGAADLLVVDAFGRLDATVPLSEECYAIWVDHAGDGYVVNNFYAEIDAVDATGACTVIGDFSDAEVYPYGVYGIVTGPDGTIYATTLDALYTVADGTITEVARWPCDFADPAAHELAAYSLAVDYLTGEVGLFGYFGGFATWTPEGGVDMQLTEDLTAPAVYTYSGAHKDGGTWFTPGIDAADGSYNIYRYADGWEVAETWEDEDWVPFMLAMDSEEGDFYVTANAGWYATVWRVVQGSGYAAPLYASSGAQQEFYYGIVASYTYGD